MRVVSKVVLAVLAAFVCAHAQTVPAPTVVEIAASDHVLVRWSDGAVTVMGRNDMGQAARPKVELRFMPAMLVNLPRKATHVAAGENSSHVVLDDGSVWAWGSGFHRELGVDLKGARERETPAVMPNLPGRDVVQVSGENKTLIALLKDGTVRTWGQLPQEVTGGERVYPGSVQPVAMPGLKDITAVTGNAYYGMALTRGGRVWTWGRNDRGQLGLDFKSVSNAPELPTELPGLQDVVSIARTAVSGAAVTRDGRVWTWGHSDQGGLGDGHVGSISEPTYQRPQPLKGITDAVEIQSGTYGRQFIVRRRGGTLIGWGNSDWGQLGAGVAGNFQPDPTAIKLPGVDAYWLGGNFAFARTTDGAIWFWGEESAARALLGVRGNQRVPMKVPMEKLRPAAGT